MGSLRRCWGWARRRRAMGERPTPPPELPDAGPDALGVSRRSEVAGDGPVLRVGRMTKRFGGLAAVADVDLVVGRGTVHALIGPNGSGKTTLLNVVSGLYRADGGSIELAGHDVGGASAARRNRLGLARTFQNLQLWRRMTVVENVMVGAHGTSRVGLAQSVLGTPWSRRSERRLRERAQGLLHFVGLAHKAHDLA